MFEKNNNKAYLYLAPGLILILLFIIYPLINTFLTSFMLDYNYMTGTRSGWGFDNYFTVLRSSRFRVALKNTMIITFVSVPVSVIIALLIAVGLNSIKRFQGFLQTIFFLPYVTNVIAIGMVFSFMFNRNYGLVNTFLGWFGMNPINWVGPGASYWHAMTTLLIYTVWSGLPFKIMVFLSGLQSIDKQYYQAAQVDATPKWRVFLRITVPMLSPMIMYITITSFIGAFKAYATVVAMFGESAGPAGQARMLSTVVWYVYDALQQTRDGAISIASAASVILFLIILAFTAIQMYVSKKRVHY
jgi:multiple sugar transport system permease protein